MSERNPVISEETPDSTPPVSLPPPVVSREWATWASLMSYLQGMGGNGISVDAEKVAGDIYKLLGLKKPENALSEDPEAEEVPPTVALPRPPTRRPVAPELPTEFHVPSIPPLETNED